MKVREESRGADRIDRVTGVTLSGASVYCSYLASRHVTPR